MQYQAVNHTIFDTIKTVATMTPYHIMGLRLFSIFGWFHKTTTNTTIRDFLCYDSLDIMVPN